MMSRASSQATVIGMLGIFAGRNVAPLSVSLAVARDA